MTRLEQAEARMIKTQQEKAGITIIYHFDSINSIELVKKCWTGRQMFRIVDGDVSRIEWSDRDYMIPVAELLNGGILTLPARGHWIEQVFPLPKGNERYKLQAPESEPVWRYSNPQNTIYRIHTKKG